MTLTIGILKAKNDIESVDMKELRQQVGRDRYLIQKTVPPGFGYFFVNLNDVLDRESQDWCPAKPAMYERMYQRRRHWFSSSDESEDEMICQPYHPAHFWPCTTDLKTKHMIRTLVRTVLSAGGEALGGLLWQKGCGGFPVELAIM
jgi:hypothetical protein